MLLKTHFMFAIFLIILFLGYVQDKFLFIGIVLIATVLPDLDTKFSSYGRHSIFRPLQFFVKHRGIVHSFTAAIFLALIFAVFWPVVSFGIFIGYSVHLFCDSFTPEGIQPFWPFKSKSSGPIHTGGRIEESIFFSLIFINFVLFFLVFVLR